MNELLKIIPSPSITYSENSFRSINVFFVAPFCRNASTFNFLAEAPPMAVVSQMGHRRKPKGGVQGGAKVGAKGGAKGGANGGAKRGAQGGAKGGVPPPSKGDGNGSRVFNRNCNENITMLQAETLPTDI